MEQETMNITYPAKDVEDIIRTYFGDALKQVSVTMMGRIALVTIAYEDFHTKRMVRRELEDKIPNIEIDSLERIYSRKTRLNILDELLESETEIYIKETNGSLRKTDIQLLVEEMLYHRNFN